MSLGRPHPGPVQDVMVARAKNQPGRYRTMGWVYNRPQFRHHRSGTKNAVPDVSKCDTHPHGGPPTLKKYSNDYFQDPTAYECEILSRRQRIGDDMFAGYPQHPHVL